MRAWFLFVCQRTTDGRTDGRTGGHVFGMPLVKLRFLFANYDRVETTQEYDLETTNVDTIRSELFEKIPELNLPEEEKVENLSQLRLFEGGKLMVDGKTLKESNVSVSDAHPTVVTVSIRPLNISPSKQTKKAQRGEGARNNETQQSGCCTIF